MNKYIVIELQNGNIGGNNWPYDERADAEVKFYQVLAEVVKSPIETHTVMLVTGEGFVLDCKCYKHGEEPEPESTESEVA
ncbi:MAG: hypothetical protein IJ943_03760 [Akkermansia sp.]|nr:hypothetical protein [Akkermansia sp.]MBR2683110.1 hypothetical protein [Atopobiaceae bacterium]MBR3387538.1 hypothetical protein [Bacteroidales bacterium]